MPESYTSGPNRVIIRHRGPAGKGIPVGGTAGQILAKTGPGDYDTDWVEAPDGTDAVVFGGTAPANNELVLFNGTTGKLVKRSSILASSLAFVADLATKVNVDGAKVLSTNDFTNALKTKLDNLPAAGFFRGNFANIAAVNAFSFAPVPAVGDYVTVAGPAFARYWWNPAGAGAWVIETVSYTPVAADLADILFDNGETWTLAGNIMFTPAYAALINAHETIINNLGLGTSATTPKGYASYFSIAGQIITITTISDGSNNYVLVNPATAVSGNSSQFTGGTGSLGRLQYTGTISPRVFSIHATVSHSGAAGDVIAFTIAKNGTIISEARTLSEIKTVSEVHQVNVTALVSLATNDYVEVFVANTSSTDDVKVHALAITASLV
jgi:hypothetical protein